MKPNRLVDRAGVKVRLPRGRIGILLLVGGLFLGACARPGAPPGGPQDRIPPMVVSTWPDTFATIEPTRDAVTVSFSERISERPTRGSLEEAVQVSPEMGEHRVKHGRGGLEISVIGGFQPNLVYRIRVLPTIKDMFGNAMDGPFELVFSTGAEFEANVLAGEVRDRITDDPVEGARVEARARGEEDPAVHVSSTDTAGIYLLRFLPDGVYEVDVFDDLNRNREADYSERQGTTSGSLGTLGERTDTLIRGLVILQPDTTPAQVIRVEAEDSVLLRISFDDYLSPGEALATAQIQLTLDSVPGPSVERLLWQHQLDSLRAFADSVEAAESLRIQIDSLRGVVDSLRGRAASFRAAGDTLGADSVGVALEGAEAVLGALEAPEEPVGPEEEEVQEGPRRDLPEQFFFALLGEPLAPGLLYHLTAVGVRNLASVSGGGGEVGVSWTPPELAVDTAGVAPDTAAVPPDTAGVPPDTAGARSEGVVGPEVLAWRRPPTFRPPPRRGSPWAGPAEKAMAEFRRRPWF
ncbi:Ig-like domain-containing protein [Gemmatimonadota bacterium]